MKLSYSAISTYETCPAKFRFQYEERIPRGSSPALAFGDSLHRTLHRFHNRPVPVAPSLEELWVMLEDEWVAYGFGDEGEERLYRQHAREVLARYHRENADAYRIPAALEFGFRIEVDGIPLQGTIDRMDRPPEAGTRSSTTRRTAGSRRKPSSTGTCSSRSTRWPLARSGGSSPRN